MLHEVGTLHNAQSYLCTKNGSPDNCKLINMTFPLQSLPLTKKLLQLEHLGKLHVKLTPKLYVLIRN